MKDQIALVTGATRGIGRAIALALAARGAKVIGTATSEAGAATIREALSATGGDGIVLDVTDGAALHAAVDRVVEQHRGLHILVNNAGITRDNLSMRMKDDEWDAVHDTNLKAVFRASLAGRRADDLGAARSERQRDRTADAARGAGDEGDLVFHATRVLASASVAGS